MRFYVYVDMRMIAMVFMIVLSVHAAVTTVDFVSLSFSETLLKCHTREAIVNTGPAKATIRTAEDETTKHCRSPPPLQETPSTSLAPVRLTAPKINMILSDAVEHLCDDVSKVCQHDLKSVFASSDTAHGSAVYHRPSFPSYQHRLGTPIPITNSPNPSSSPKTAAAHP